jgi:hypothetical protein
LPRAFRGIKNDKNNALIDDSWKQYKKGGISLDDARQQILEVGFLWGITADVLGGRKDFLTSSVNHGV